MQIDIVADLKTTLGEGPLWHPHREELFWFDILHKRLHMKGEDGLTVWDMPDLTSAAAILSQDALLLASESALWRFDIATGSQSRLVALDAEDSGTRSNDGRADRQGGFWIGTMGKRGPHDPGRGAIWRYHKGELRKLFPGLTIPNSICFDATGTRMYFCDSTTPRILHCRYDAATAAVSDVAVFVDLDLPGAEPDGSIIDAEGALWNAQWGGSMRMCGSIWREQRILPSA